jgi:hypothetical protein
MRRRKRRASLSNRTKRRTGRDARRADGFRAAECAAERDGPGTGRRRLRIDRPLCVRGEWKAGKRRFFAGSGRFGRGPSIGVKSQVLDAAKAD